MNDDVYDIVDIRDPEIDVEDIMRRIRADAKRLQAQTGDTTHWPVYGTAAPTASADEDLYEHLHRAFATYDKLYVEMILTRRNRPSFAPLAALRRACHGLALFYVNTLGSKQTLFNTQVVHTLNRLAEGLEVRSSTADVAMLQETIRLLEQRVADLEDQLNRDRADNGS